MCCLHSNKQALTTSGKSQKQKHLQRDVREAFKWPWRRFTQEHLPSTWWERWSLTVNWPHHNFQLTFSKLSFNKRHCVGTCKSDYADRRRSPEHIQCDIRNRQRLYATVTAAWTQLDLNFTVNFVSVKQRKRQLPWMMQVIFATRHMIRLIYT